MRLPEGEQRACTGGTGAISAPILDQGPYETLENVQAHVPRGELSLSGPSDRSDRTHLPVRGDLAHIRLAGRYFVPHYVVPMPHTVIAGPVPLRAAASPAADALCELAKDSVFAVLDIAGNWAWGQQGEDGLVGYVPVANLKAS
jgi:hypothetical protein